MSHSGHGGGSVIFPIPEDPYFAKIYWMFVGGAIAAGTLVHLGELLLYRQRISAASGALPEPARPKNPLVRWYATLTAMTREVVCYTAPLVEFRTPLSRAQRAPWNLPRLGRVLLIAANLALLLSLVFYGWDVNDRRNWEAMAVRTGWVTIAQLPLVFLLAGKRNLIGYATGTSYERLNWIHRWVSRCMFVTASIHLGYFFRTWGQYDYIERKLELDLISRRGLGAWCTLLWITLSSFAPIRGCRYEFFVVQHVVSFTGFVVMVMLHSPRKAHVYVWLPVAVFLLDRTLRFAFVLYNNLAIFHRARRQGAASGMFTCEAAFYALTDNATKVVIPNPPFSWAPGQHAFVSCHSLIPLQSHPFTIATLSSDASLEFLIRTQTGGTRKLSLHARGSLPRNDTGDCKTVIIDGPYGRVRPLEQFDTVFLLAGGAGATFVIPLFRYLVQLKRSSNRIVTRKIHLCWVVKSSTQTSWFAKEISEAMQTFDDDREPFLKTSIYVTCDSTFTQQTTAQKEGEAELCAGDRCCCQDVILEAGEKQPVCCCAPKTDLTAASSRDSLAASLSLPPGDIFSGRPPIETLVNGCLEKALGESAVVVCGPAELIEESRRVVVCLSDRRAVHKGTGAQGVYLHTEAFCW